MVPPGTASPPCARGLRGTVTPSRAAAAPPGLSPQPMDRPAAPPRHQPSLGTPVPSLVLLQLLAAAPTDGVVPGS